MRRALLLMGLLALPIAAPAGAEEPGWIALSDSLDGPQWKQPTGLWYIAGDATLRKEARFAARAFSHSSVRKCFRQARRNERNRPLSGPTPFRKSLRRRWAKKACVNSRASSGLWPCRRTKA